jgi:hypothetical protein
MRMPWVRTTWLILLTLIATTLPSSALTVQQRDPREKQAAKAVRSQEAPEAAQNAPAPADKGPARSAVLKIAPNTELWDGSGARTLSFGSSLETACLTGHMGGPNLVPEERPSFPHIVEVTTPRSSQRAWLSSHNPHAPPA